MTQNDAMDIETGGVVDEVTQISRTPNIYILLVDSYLSKQGLKAKNLEALDIGPRLKEKGFVVYDNAFSNYKSSGPSMTAFLDIEHHYYKKKTDRIKKLTGSNQLYELLRENGYKTMVLHPTDFFVRGDCQSDYCYPSPSFFGQIDFILSQTILFSDGFYQRMGVGMFRFKQKIF